MKDSIFRDSTKGESHIEERGGRPEALARSLRCCHKIKSKEEIGSSREKARWRASSSSIFIYFGGFYTMSRATMCNIMG